MEFLYEYGLFLAKAITLVVAVGAIVVIVVASAVKQKSDRGELKLTHLSDELKSLKHHLKAELLGKKAFKPMRNSSRPSKRLTTRHLMPGKPKIPRCMSSSSKVA